MAKEPGDEDDTLELTEDMEAEAGPDDEGQDGDVAGASDDPDGEGDEETVIGFADEAGSDEAAEGRAGETKTIRDMRAQLKESHKRIRELEQSTPASPKVERRPKPTLAGNNYDEEAFEADLDAWKAEEATADAQTARAEEESKAANESWAEAKRRYDAEAAKHGFDDIEEDEAAIDRALGKFAPVVLKAANNPALMVRALGRSPAKLAELAKIKDPFELAANIARMEGTVTVVKKRKGPAIDKPQQGSGKTPVSGEKGKQLEKLEKDAEKSGDRTKLIAYKKANGL